MMFEYAFSLTAEAADIRTAVQASLDENVRTGDIQIAGLRPYSTSEVGQWLTARIKGE